MDVVLSVPYDNGDPVNGFKYEKGEIEPEKYAKMVVDTYNKYKDGIMDVVHSRLGKNMSINSFTKEFVEYKQQGYYYTQTEAKFLTTEGKSFPIEEFLYLYEKEEPFILVINMPYLGREENADLESDIMSLAREYKKVFSYNSFSEIQKINCLSQKTFKVFFKDVGYNAVLNSCRMVGVKNNRTFVFLVDKIIFVTYSST